MIRAKQRIMMNDELYNWIFHYNTYNNVWSAFNREDYHAYWNGEEPKYAILKAKDIKTIQEIIIKTKGDKTKLNELTQRVGKKRNL